jgi:hypothetical protein
MNVQLTSFSGKSDAEEHNRCEGCFSAGLTAHSRGTPAMWREGRNMKEMQEVPKHGGEVCVAWRRVLTELSRTSVPSRRRSSPHAHILTF